MDDGTRFVIAGTLFFVLFFVGVVVYAFDRRRAREFDHQANLPLEDTYPIEAEPLDRGASS